MWVAKATPQWRQGSCGAVGIASVAPWEQSIPGTWSELGLYALSLFDPPSIKGPLLYTFTA
jgi:hypothetical protein